MSCRRGELERLVACHVGATAIRGCSRECCPYGDDKYEENERLSFDNANYAMGSYVVDPLHDMHRPCRHTFRPKYVCTDCHRAYKMHVHPDNDYYCEQFSNRYYWRPKSTYPKMLTLYRNLKKEDPEKAAKFELLMNGPPNLSMFSREEIHQLEEIHPWIWKPLEDLRCPTCGKPGQLVGTTFRAPTANDRKGWQEVRRLLDQGERFLPCPSVEEYEEMTLEGQRLRIRAMQDEEWQREKTDRITILTNTSRESATLIENSRGLE